METIENELIVTKFINSEVFNEIFEDIIDESSANPRPAKRIRTSILTGARWTEELLNGSDVRFREVARMEKNVFGELVEVLGGIGLHSTRGVAVQEQVLIFLYVVGHHASNRDAQERFQHSGDTISLHFQRVLTVLVSLSYQEIKLSSFLGTHPQIQNNRKYFPYFKDCIGAIDGTHIPVIVTKHDRPDAWRNRKGFMSTNVLAACSFDLLFLYILPGYEGTAHDAHVLAEAMQRDFKIPRGKYYLGDAGYGLAGDILVPYRRVRYHLKEWDRANRNPENALELFNLRHSSLRNHIERIFGVLKSRFPILSTPQAFAIKDQIRLVRALCGLHNFIRTHSANPDDELRRYEERADDDEQRDEVLAEVGPRDKTAGQRLRSGISDAMWADYLRRL